MPTEYRRYYEIGGIPFSVITPEPFEEKEPYSMFSVSERDTLCDYVFSFADSLPEPDGKFLFEDPYYRAYEKDGEIHRYVGYYHDGKICNDPYAEVSYRIDCPDTVKVIMAKDKKVPMKAAFIYRCLCIEHLVSSNGGLLLHSSFIDTGDGAILFTAPSETGKSTQAELWRRHRGARVINGDCSVIRKKDGVMRAWGLPFSGTSNICLNESCDLKAVVYLTQAPENRAERLGGAMAFRALLEGTKINIWSTADTDATTSLIAEIARSVPVIKLDCLPDEGAVETLEKALEK